MNRFVCFALLALFVAAAATTLDAVDFSLDDDELLSALAPEDATTELDANNHFDAVVRDDVEEDAQDAKAKFSVGKTPAPPSQTSLPSGAAQAGTTTGGAPGAHDHAHAAQILQHAVTNKLPSDSSGKMGQQQQAGQ